MKKKYMILTYMLVSNRLWSIEKDDCGAGLIDLCERKQGLRPANSQ